MDFATDSTNVMKRHGQVYPLVRAAGIGYGYGHRRSKNEEYNKKGVCAEEIGPECGDWWSHLKTHNSYNGGQLSRNVDKDISKRISEERQRLR